VPTSGWHSVDLGHPKLPVLWFTPCQPEGWHSGDLGHPKPPVLRFVLRATWEP
jgi:hypothetical protein